MPADKSKEALEFMASILAELKTMNQVNNQLVQQTSQLVRQNAQLTQQLAASASQERDTQNLLAQLGHRIGELSGLLVEEDPNTQGYPLGYQQQPTLGQLLNNGLEAFGVRQPPRGGRRRRGG